MRILATFLLIAGISLAQNLTEFGAVTAGSTVGGASGKAVSNGITAIFGKVDRQTAQAAVKETKKENQPEVEALKIAPGAPQEAYGDVPLPPSAPSARAPRRSAPVAEYVVPEDVARIGLLAEMIPVLPPPAVMSPEEFRSISLGEARADVLKFGAPASKITMFEDGHVVEQYSYHQNGQRFGGLRLTDGVVSSIQ
ncbi:MAG: hypothetical protein ABI833_09635 [Acidobacteriota bacterium]